MSKFYIFLNDQQIGPLSFEELKGMKINRDIQVWFEGLGDWKKASEIEELKSIIISIPPPINKFNSKSRSQEVENNQTIYNDEEHKILGFKRNIFFTLFTVLIVIIILFYFNNIQENSKLELLKQNQETVVNNQQQKEIEKQKERLTEQEKIEIKRAEIEKAKKYENRLLELNDDLSILHQNLSVAKENLNNATEFKLLRTSAERNEQINFAQSDVDFINQQIKNVEIEIVKISKNAILQNQSIR